VARTASSDRLLIPSLPKTLCTCTLTAPVVMKQPSADVGVGHSRSSPDPDHVSVTKPTPLGHPPRYRAVSRLPRLVSRLAEDVVVWRRVARPGRGVTGVGVDQPGGRHRSPGPAAPAALVPRHRVEIGERGVPLGVHDPVHVLRPSDHTELGDGLVGGDQISMPGLRLRTSGLRSSDRTPRPARTGRRTGRRSPTRPTPAWPLPSLPTPAASPPARSSRPVPGRRSRPPGRSPSAGGIRPSRRPSSASSPKRLPARATPVAIVSRLPLRVAKISGNGKRFEKTIGER
jgi:hypothetical protein